MTVTPKTEKLKREVSGQRLKPGVNENMTRTFNCARRFKNLRLGAENCRRQKRRGRGGVCRRVGEPPSTTDRRQPEPGNGRGGGAAAAGALARAVRYLCSSRPETSSYNELA